MFNYFLNLWNEEYKKTGKGLSYNKCAVIIPTLKKLDEYSWLKEVDSIALQSSVKNLEDSFNRFFKKQTKAPKFKSKKNPTQSYITKNVGKGIQIQGNSIKLPKLKMVKFSNSREINGRILRVTIIRKASGKYFISLLVEENIQELEKTNSSVGIDLGIKDFAILDDGTTYNNNRYTTKMAKQLAREQHKLSRRYEQAKKDGKKLEDAKLISDVSWSMFVTKLQYKADWYGKKVVKIDRWYPSSQMCSNCGVNSGKKTLDIRYWECECGTKHDRDINASINIKKEGLRQVV